MSDTTPVQQTDERNLAILADLQEGLSYRALAAKYHCSLTTICALVAKMRTTEQVARKYMAAKALDQVERWDAATIEAAKKGDHRPMKDWLLHVGAIEPLEHKGQGAGITIVVGNGQAPVIQLPTIDVQPAVDQALTDDQAT